LIQVAENSRRNSKAFPNVLAVTSGIFFKRMIGVLPPAVRRRSLRSGFVPASLRLRSTFPFAEPQAEAKF
jgi:hypothetical protein